ncbi:heterokaryon incompatibility protein-domain-containing protein, partial [Flammula alnicola]
MDQQPEKFNNLRRPQEDWQKVPDIGRVLRKHASYAILSHTWLQKKPEVIYGDAKDTQKWWSVQSKRGMGYRKLEGFCRVAREDYSVSLAWMDTICINKDSTSELDESIRSMYRWYKNASVCVVYLGDSTSLDDMHADRWFTRGWTLQELLASGLSSRFYNKHWKAMIDPNDFIPAVYRSLGSFSEILPVIQKATGIDPKDLYGFEAGLQSGVASRMSWAAKRTTTREEDQAYSMMGIFDVSFPIAYGEGADRAFLRLIEAMLASDSHCLDVFNFAGQITSRCSSQVIPSSPESY